MADNRLGFNERKKRILEFLRENNSTAQEVATEMGIEDGAARHLLTRYHLNGLVIKSKFPESISKKGRNPYLYKLSDQGKELLQEGKIRTRSRS